MDQVPLSQSLSLSHALLHYNSNLPFLFYSLDEDLNSLGDTKLVSVGFPIATTKLLIKMRPWCNDILFIHTRFTKNIC